MDIAMTIMAAKLGRTRKEAQEDTCTVFAAALFDLLSARGIPCQMVTAVKSGFGSWAHAIVEVDGHYYDSMGEFSTDIYRARARIHPSVSLDIAYSLDERADCYEEEFEGMYSFFLKELTKAVAATNQSITGTSCAAVTSRLELLGAVG